MRLILGEFTRWAMEKHKLLLIITYAVAFALAVVGGYFIWVAE